MICIVKRDRHIGKTLRFSLFRARENNVLHAVAAKLFCTLFAEYPAHCIRHIALAAAANDESVVKFEARPYLQQLKRINDILHTLRSFEFEEYHPGDELDRLPTDPLYDPSVYQYWNEVLPQVVDKEYTRFQMYTIVTNLIEEFEKNQNDTMTMIYKL